MPSIPSMSSSASTCPCCFEEVVHGSYSHILLPCGHSFHFECITVWINTSKHKDCAICRATLPPSYRKLLFTLDGVEEAKQSALKFQVGNRMSNFATINELSDIMTLYQNIEAGKTVIGHNWPETVTAPRGTRIKITFPSMLSQIYAKGQPLVAKYVRAVKNSVINAALCQKILGGGCVARPATPLEWTLATISGLEKIKRIRTRYDVCVARSKQQAA